MPDHLAGVKALTRNYHTWAKTNLAEKPDIAKRQAANAADLEALIAEVEAARGRLRSVANTLGDLSDLPPRFLPN